MPRPKWASQGVRAMTRMLLAAAGMTAALALCSGSAQAQDWTHRPSHHAAGRRAASGAVQRGCRDGACSIGAADAAAIDGLYAGAWADSNNRSWEATSYNDWWHEEPWRAYPAWMRNNRDCARQWYAGDTLRC